MSGATVNTSTISNKENEFATLSKESNLTTSSSYFRPEDKPALSLFQQSTDVSLGDVLAFQSFPTAFKLGCDSFPSLSSSTSVPSSCSVLTATNVCTQIASASSCSDSGVTKFVGSVQKFPTNQIPIPGFPAPQGLMFSGLVLEFGIGRGGSSLNVQGEAGGEVSVASDITNPEHNNLFAEGGAGGALLPKINATAGAIRVDAMMNQRSVSSRKVHAPNPVSGFPPRVSCSVPSKSSGLVRVPNFTFQGQSVTTVPPGFPPKESRFLQSVISGMANKAPSCPPLTQSIPTIKAFSSGGLVQGVHVGVQGLTSLVTGNDECQLSSQNLLISYNPEGTGITQIDRNQNHLIHPVLGSHSFVTAIPTCSINDTSICSSARTQERMTRGVLSFPGYSGVCDTNQSMCPSGNLTTGGFWASSATRPSSQLPSATQTFSTPFAAPFVVPGTINYDSLFLPRPEFPKFAGDPLEFRSFISNFETHVEPRIHDEQALICLLSQHCSKPVKISLNIIPLTIVGVTRWLNRDYKRSTVLLGFLQTYVNRN